MPRVKRLRSWDSYGLTLVITCIDAICDRLRALAGKSRSCWVGSFFSSSVCSYEMPNAPEITSEVGPTGGLVCGEPDFAALDHCKDDRWFAGEQSASDQVWQGTVHNDEWDLGLDDAGGHAQVVGGGVGHGLASLGRVLSGVDRSWVFG